MRSSINPEAYNLTLEEFVNANKVLAKAEGVPEKDFIQMLKADYKLHAKPLKKTVNK